MASDRSKLCVSVAMINISALLSIPSQIHGILMAWKLHQARINNFIIASITRKKKLYHKKLRILRERANRRKKKAFWVSPGRSEQWWLNLVSGVTPTEYWKKNFRMSRTQFYELVEEIRPFISPNLLSPNPRVIPAEKKLAIALYYLKDTGSLTIWCCHEYSWVDCL